MDRSNAHVGPLNEVLAEVKSTVEGLSTEEAQWRLAALQRQRRAPRAPEAFWLLLKQVANPLTLILSVAAILSFFLGNRIDALIILTIVTVSGLLGFGQEYAASHAVRKLLALIATHVLVKRDGQEVSLPLEQIVPGDVVVLTAGDKVPGDCVLLESRDLYLDEASITGESAPVEKHACGESEPPSEGSRLYLGSHAVSGSGVAMVTHVGRDAVFGAIAERLRMLRGESNFERGARQFGNFLLEVTLWLVVAIFAVNVFFERPVLEAFLFAVALAVGMIPQLLPAIISVILAHGARRMAKEDVIVRRLAAIENFGSMDVLCTDKTGTLTQGVVRIKSALDPEGNPSDAVLHWAYVNASFASGYVNPIDQAIRQTTGQELSAYQKCDEIPYDFVRRRLSVLVNKNGERMLVMKGAVDNVLTCCEWVESGGELVPFANVLSDIRARYESLGDAGYRTLGVAVRRMQPTCDRVDAGSEREMVFAGVLVLEDPPKDHMVDTLARLRGLGIRLKMITGDNRRVAKTVAQAIGMSVERIITGDDLRTMAEAALVHLVGTVDVFSEIQPNQKERIILACRKGGHVVGYLGDGINDATALRAADVGISVNQAADVAKEAADIVLLKPELQVLVEGVRQGRMAFGNTMKYVFMATSANFGNMFSMAGASLFLDFLPLLPKQILLMNLLTDIPEMTIAGDRLDEEVAASPQRWDMKFIRRFMLVFGPISSAFDFLTFAVLLLFFRADQTHFRTAWFTESVVSAALVVLVVRTRRSVLSSRPGRWLAAATLALIAVTVTLPWWPIAPALGFAPLPPRYLAAVLGIALLYGMTCEVAKYWFYHRGNGSVPKTPREHLWRPKQARR